MARNLKSMRRGQGTHFIEVLDGNAKLIHLEVPGTELEMLVMQNNGNAFLT